MVEAYSVERARPRTVKRWGKTLLLAALLAAALGLRISGIDWDENAHLHPDERFLTMVASSVESPGSLALYLDTANSPLNPYNRGYADFFYGTLPLFVTRYAGQWVSTACAEEPSVLARAFARVLSPGRDVCSRGPYTNYDNIYLVGRFLSALSDVGALIFMFLIGRRLYGSSVALWAVALGALAVFPIQHSHFFAVDNFAAFFVVVTLYFAVRIFQAPHWSDFALAGLSAGLALACKISVWPVVLVIGLAGLVHLWPNHKAEKARPGVGTIVLLLCLAALLAFLAFRLAQPYSFQGPGLLGLRLNQQWLDDMRDIRGLTNTGETDIPYTRQWSGRPAVFFSWVNMVVWGVGLPLGVAAWIGWALVGVELLRGRREHLLLWLWGTGFFIYQSSLWIKTMRYLLPVYHVFILFGAYVLWRLALWSLSRRGVRRLALLVPVGVLAGTSCWALAFVSIYTRTHTRIAASRWIYENVPSGATIANEHWDDELPLGLAGYSGEYQRVYMENYNDDTPDKRVQLFGWLDATDYILLTSNRLYASIPRLPDRYPLTTAYYRALFAGRLGFELAADFTSYPELGPFQFPDEEAPFPLMEAADYDYQPPGIRIPLPPAEEAFSVYDHPRVLIFRKTAAYSPALVESVLGQNEIDLTQAVVGLRAKDAGDVSRLRFDDRTWADQQAGGTWSAMFSRDSLLNRTPGLAAIAWWIVVTLLGWLAFPLLFVAVPRLRDRGYGLARVLALLLVAYLTWLAASLHLLPNTRATILRMAALLAVAGGGVGWFKRHELRRFVSDNWRMLIWTEGLFAALYVAWIGVRLLDPDLWHPYVGGEKPMDVAYLNAVIKSTWFPPYNPWLSGGTINYYYFGFVIVGALIKLMGTVPTIAYNLTIPLLFALTGVGAFSVAYNLYGGSRRGALLAGVTALAFAVVLGNLGVVRLLVDTYVSVGGGEDLFPSTIPGFPATMAAIRGFFRIVFASVQLPIGPGSSSWYWYPTRIIPPEAGNPIAEFPAFTFLYADLHAHMIALPLVLLAMTLSVYWVLGSRPRWWSLMLGGLVIGALRPTNTWDYPTYLALGLAALTLAAWRAPGPWQERARALSWRAAALVGLSVLFYLPYIVHYAAGYASVERWPGLHTPFAIYLLIHGILLFPLLTYLGGEARRVVARLRQAQPASFEIPLRAGAYLVWRRLKLRIHWRFRKPLTVAPWLLLLFVLLCAPTLVLAGLDYGVAWIAAPVAVLAACVVLVPGRRTVRRFLWLLVSLAMALSLIVEIVVLKGDIGRMNTVFKFYLQVWMLLSVVAGVALAQVAACARRWQPDYRRLWWVGMGLLILGGALFLPFGIRARANDRISNWQAVSQAGPTLDGMAFMEYSVVPDEGAQREVSLKGDYYAIRWMQDHIPGSPVIMEGLGAREYLWGSRVSIYTGLPAVVGWRWHEAQQRPMLAGEVDLRRNDVNECYNTTDVLRARAILARYGVRYAYVGDYERGYYDPAGLAKFDVMAAEGMLRVVYDAQEVRIYEVVR